MAPQKRPVPITFGRLLSRVGVGDVIITETQHGAGSSLGFHDHEAPNLNFVLSGSHMEKFRSREMYCGRGSLVVKPGGAVHANQYGNAGSHAVVLEFGGRSAQDDPWSRVFREVRWVDGGVASVRAWQVVAEARRQAPAWQLRVEELLLQLCAELACGPTRDAAPSGSWLSELFEYLDAHYDQRLTVASVAARFGVHPVYLTRAFRKRFGCTVAQFVRRKRLHRAIQELTSAPTRIAAVAADCGFYDQSHLTNALRAVTGLSPMALRALADQ